MNKNIPTIAQGTQLPIGVYELEYKELKEKQNRRLKFRHDWGIAVFSVIGGGVAGVVTTLITLYIQGLL